VHGALLAVVHPDNTPHGYNWTFAFPMLMFIIIAGALFLRFRGPHNVPGRISYPPSRGAASARTGSVNVGDATVHAPAKPDAAAATEATAVAGQPAEGASVEPASVEQARPADEGTEEG
jgi:hypothetical protein